MSKPVADFSPASSGEPAGDCPNKPPYADVPSHANTPNREGGMRDEQVYPVPVGFPPPPRRR